MKSCLPIRASRPRGAALIITLLIIALLTVMVVAFLDTSRIERSVSAHHMERSRAALLAREGVSRTVALLQKETVDAPRQEGETEEQFALRKRNWISQPGALLVPDALPASQKEIRRKVELSSGTPQTTAPTSPVFEPANLNVQILSDPKPGSRLITDIKDPATGKPVPLKLRWIYVREDVKGGGLSYDTAEEPDLRDSARPIVGRFAYWVDDESSKINCNLAWKRTPSGTPPARANQHPASHPSRINLTSLMQPDGARLDEAAADALHQEAATRPFNSFTDARRIEEMAPGISSLLSHNKFELTHYNQDPDTTFFGEERIMLTTNPALVPKNADGTYARKFLDILRDDPETLGLTKEQLDPGNYDHLAAGQPDYAGAGSNVLLPNKLDGVVRDLMRYISSREWPISPGVSFKDKYYPGAASDSDAQLSQLAVNIIDYVRAKESAMDVFAPMRFGPNPAGELTTHPSYGYAGSNTFLGISRAPYITEVGMYMKNDPVPVPNPVPSGWPRDTQGKPKNLYPLHYRFEVFLPPNYGVDDGVDLVPDKDAEPTPNSSYGWHFSNPDITASDSTFTQYLPGPGGRVTSTKGRSITVRIFKEDIEGGQTKLMPGQRLVVNKVLYRDAPWSVRKYCPWRLAMYLWKSDAEGFMTGPHAPRIVITPEHGTIRCDMGDPGTTTPANMVSHECDDPRASVHTSDWKPNKNNGNTFGAPNSRSTVGANPLNVRPQQDVDAGGKISDASFYMPPPKGRGTNGPDGDNGRLGSVAELGYVHTGNNAATGSIPWRTLRLQVNNYTTANPSLPDWALLDLFSVANTGTTSNGGLYKPHGTSVGGRVNVNSRTLPFENLTRSQALVALLTGANGMTLEKATEIAGNIYRRELSPLNNRLGKSFGKSYGFPWKAAPVATDANAYDIPWEICEVKGVADEGEASESLVREIGSLITSRGGVFTVYTVGQAMKQTSSGQLTVTAEQRQQVMLERYVTNRGTANAADDEVRFRVVYSRNLTP
ncbi:hypothetical protein [Verrucomicrobium spinosum]|uniref:hypothetical protein n=2 Tax=Verrucomicrobium spinosum TaxID=2736 RepID=UPI0001746981|nr:hypothetical protein [Verrucomicrobium spinosum]